MLRSPRKRIWPSLKRSAPSKTLRQAVGLKKGNSPSTTSISAQAPNARFHQLAPTRGYFFGAGADELPRIALKNSVLGSTTITSDLLRKLARYASRLR